MIYLDSASTTKIDKRVLDAMLPYLTDQYGNPGTLYSFGRASHEAVESARKSVSELIGSEPEQIIFTSGGSESNNMVFTSVYKRDSLKHKTIVSSSIEHDSVLNCIKHLNEDLGIGSTLLPVNDSGYVNIEDVKSSLNENVGLVSVMYVNNETGAENPVDEIGRLCKEMNIPFHTDCVQAIGDHDIDVNRIKCDFLSMSSHKIHGAKGVGALYVRNPESMNPLIYGGHFQEHGLRGGTENVAGIVGFGKACELLKANRKIYDSYISLIKRAFVEALRGRLRKYNFEDILFFNGASNGKILNIRFDGVDGETLILMLDAKGVCVSAGSACRSHENTPSRVLLSMGLDPEAARNSIRVSFSRQNSECEVYEAACLIADCVRLLRNGIQNS